MHEPVIVTLAGQDYTTLAQHLNHTWAIDEPEELGGKDLGPAPNDVLLSALGACTAITLRMYANRKGWEIESIAVSLQYTETASNASPVTTIERKIEVKGNLEEKDRQRLLQIANACPVHKILSGEIRISSEIVA